MDIKQQIKQFTSQYQTTGWLLLFMAGGLLFQGLLFIIFSVSGNVELYDKLITYLVLPGNLKDLLLQPWSIITYPFFTLNASINFLHILVNGLILWAFGRIHQQLLGDKRTRRLVILVIPIIGLLTASISSFTPSPTTNSDQTVLVSEQTDTAPAPETPSATDPSTPSASSSTQSDSIANAEKLTIGNERMQARNLNLFYPSGMIAIIMVLVISSISLVPGYPIQFFLFGQVKILWVGIGLLVLEVMLALFFTPLAISIMIGGALGFLHIYLLKNQKDITEIIWSYYSEGSNRPKMTVKHGGASKPTDQKTGRKNGTSRSGAIPEEIVDRILDKISARGYESLSQEEKEILFKASSQKDEPD